jgi:hypothetical protein
VGIHARCPRGRFLNREPLRLVHLYAEKESPKYERAAVKWLRRYLAEKEPAPKNFGKVDSGLERQLDG